MSDVAGDDVIDIDEMTRSEAVAFLRSIGYSVERAEEIVAISRGEIEGDVVTDESVTPAP